MFKAFTKNITSFMGGGEEHTEEAKPSESKDVVTEGAGPSSGSEIDNTGTSEGGSSTGRRDSSKVPPPRPAPPLTPASSIHKPDTPPGTPTEQQVTRDGGSATGSDAQSTHSADGSAEPNAGEKKESIDERLGEVAEKAKQWGSYLFSVTKTAGASVSARAKELKKVVQDNTIIGDFVKEQDKFVNEKKEKARASEAAVPPWVGYNEEDQMKQQMLTLSNDKRNFLRNPPPGVQFHFDYETCYPVAMATLEADDKLQKMRFELVPKQVTEHDFWRNYFYRVSLIKQSTQLTSLAKQSNASEDKAESSPPVPGSTNTGTVAEKELAKPQAANPVDAAAASEAVDLGDDADALTSAQDEFVSDAYNLEISDEDLLKEMEALRSSPGAEGEWDFEMVGAGNGDALDADEAALEKEIMAEMNQSSDDLK